MVVSERVTDHPQTSETPVLPDAYDGVDIEIATTLRSLDERVIPTLELPILPITAMGIMRAEMGLGWNEHPEFVSDIVTSSLAEDLVPLAAPLEYNGASRVDADGVRILHVYARVREEWYPNERKLDGKAILSDACDALGSHRLGRKLRAHLGRETEEDRKVSNIEDRVAKNGNNSGLERDPSETASLVLKGATVFTTSGNGGEANLTTYSDNTSELQSNSIDPRADIPMEERYSGVAHRGMRNRLIVFDEEEMTRVDRWPIDGAMARDMAERFSGLDRGAVYKLWAYTISNKIIDYKSKINNHKNSFFLDPEDARAFTALCYGLKRLIDNRHLNSLPVKDAVVVGRRMLGEDLLVERIKPIEPSQAPLLFIRSQLDTIEQELKGVYKDELKEVGGLSFSSAVSITPVSEAASGAQVTLGVAEDRAVVIVKAGAGHDGVVENEKPEEDGAEVFIAGSRTEIANERENPEWWTFKGEEKAGRLDGLHYVLGGSFDEMDGVRHSVPERIIRLICSKATAIARTIEPHTKPPFEIDWNKMAHFIEETGVTVNQNNIDEARSELSEAAFKKAIWLLLAYQVKHPWHKTLADIPTRNFLTDIQPTNTSQTNAE